MATNVERAPDSAIVLVTCQATKDGASLGGQNAPLGFHMQAQDLLSLARTRAAAAWLKLQREYPALLKQWTGNKPLFTEMYAAAFSGGYAAAATVRGLDLPSLTRAQRPQRPAPYGTRRVSEREVNALAPRSAASVVSITPAERALRAEATRTSQIGWQRLVPTQGVQGESHAAVSLEAPVVGRDESESLDLPDVPDFAVPGSTPATATGPDAPGLITSLPTATVTAINAGTANPAALAQPAASSSTGIVSPAATSFATPDEFLGAISPENPVRVGVKHYGIKLVDGKATWTYCGTPVATSAELWKRFQADRSKASLRQAA